MATLRVLFPMLSCWALASTSALGVNALIAPTPYGSTNRAIEFLGPTTIHHTSSTSANRATDFLGPTTTRHSHKSRSRNRFFLAHQDGQDEPTTPPTSIFLDYLSLLRPVTLLQAVGAWMVGRLLGQPEFSSIQEWLAVLCVYLVYGVGMVANDCADAALDKSGSEAKRQRAIASGRVSVKQGWVFVGVLTTVSLAIAFLGVQSTKFGTWCAANLTLMLLYAGGLQNVLFLKNLLVGWLCIAPLWGAATLNKGLADTLFQTKMNLLAAAGFALGTVREVLKDVQDVDLDRGTKFTLPIWIGEQAATRLGLAALAATLGMLQTPLYRRMFAVEPLYSTAWVLACGTCLVSARKPTIDQKQAGVKKSIYVLLVGLIGSMMLAK